MFSANICKPFFPQQIHYNLESFIEYIGRIPSIRTRETSVRAHYVCYKKVEAQWLRMDDASVHKVDLMTDYNINLLFYRRANVPIQTWNLYLDFLPSWRPYNMPAHPALNNSVDSNASSNFSRGSYSRALPFKPPLITHEELSPPRPQEPVLMTPENPSRVQPKRQSSTYSQFVPDTDSESSTAPASDKEDSEYVPPENKGNKVFSTLHLNIYKVGVYLGSMLLVMTY